MDIFTELFGTRMGDNIIFTPQKIAHEMVDALPSEVWNRNTKFLDPCCKSGVYLQEIRNKLMNCVDLIEAYTDEQERLTHIETNQLYGLAINESCILIAIRNVYGRLIADSNIRYIENYIAKVKDKNTDYKKLVEGAFGEMKFDVVIGNPPYQESTGGGRVGGVIIYDKFVRLSAQLTNHISSMIVPGRWYIPNTKQLVFSQEMLNRKDISILIDYPKAGDVFSDAASIAGGISIIQIDKSKDADQLTTIITKETGNVTVSQRSLKSVPFSVKDDKDSFAFIRKERDLDIITKVLSISTNFFDKVASNVSPFGIKTNFIGSDTPTDTDTIKVIKSYGECTYTSLANVTKGLEMIDRYKVVTGTLNADGGGALSNGQYSVCNRPKILEPNEVCTLTYMVVGSVADRKYAESLEKYIRSKFTRFLINITISSAYMTFRNFQFVPLQDFTSQSDIDWSQSIANIDQQLYKKYNLTQGEIDYIEKTIKPME